MAIAKRMSTPWAKNKKVFKFILVPKGAHKKSESLPLGVILRDELKIARDMREAKKAIRGGKVLVDGRVCRDIRRGIGLFDAVEIPEANIAVRLIARKGLKVVAIPMEEAKLKVCRIDDKKAVRGRNIQLNLHDGRNIMLAKNEYSTHDSLLLSMPDQKVVKHAKFEQGAIVLVVSGSQSGRVATIQKIEKGLNRRLWLEDNGVFEAPYDGVIVIGKEKPMISLGEQ